MAATRQQILEEEKVGLLAQLEQSIEANDDTGFEETKAKLEGIEKTIEKYKALEVSRASLATPVKNGNTAVNVTKVEDQWVKDPMLGYKGVDEFLIEVMDAPRSGQLTPQLRFLATAGSDEQGTYSDPYGGFFIPEGMSPEVLSVGPEGDPTNPRMIPMEQPTLTFNARVDKTSRNTSVSGGYTVSRRAETQVPAASRAQWGQVKLEATGLYGLVYSTHQLLERSPKSFAAIIQAGMNDEFPSQMFKDKLRGTGVGEPLGVLNSPAKIGVDKVSMQAADTINGTNLVAMRKRAWKYSQCIWLANHDTMDQLHTCHVAGTNSDRFLFKFGEGEDLGDTLMGRPIYFTEYASTLGDEGDIMLINWNEYLWGTYGSTTPRRAESMHVRFLEHEMAFKFWLENDGKPWWLTDLTPMNSTVTLSPIVTLDARA